MLTLLELIESWKPCKDYNYYVRCGELTPQMTIKDILYSRGIADMDKEWFFTRLVGGVDLSMDSRKETMLLCTRGPYYNVGAEDTTYDYDYETFLAMVYEFIEYAGIDAAI